MLIRSQDKEKMINILTNDIYVIGNEVRAISPASALPERYTTLGEYGSKDRAMEVMDEMQKQFINCNLQVNHHPIANTVFVMPTE